MFHCSLWLMYENVHCVNLLYHKTASVLASYSLMPSLGSSPFTTVPTPIFSFFPQGANRIICTNQDDISYIFSLAIMKFSLRLSVPILFSVG